MLLWWRGLALAAGGSADIILLGQAARMQVNCSHQFTFDLLYLSFDVSYLLIHD